MTNDVVNVEELSSTEYKISIQVPSKSVDEKFTEFFKSIKKETQVPGFRKGKAPIARLKQLYGQKSRPTIVQMLVGEYYSKALQENDITPIGNPKIDDLDPSDKYPGKFGFDNSYSVSLTVEVLPTIDPQGYNGMELDFPEHNVEELFEKKMAGYQEQFAEKSQITERGAELGDALVIDFAGYIDGDQFDGGSATGHSLDVLGKSHFIPGFEEQVVGVKAGESKEISIKFPEKYHAEHLAGKNVKFDVTVHSIVETKLAEVNEDLAMMVGYESIDELNTHVTKEVDDEQKVLNRSMLDQQIVTKLLEVNQFDVPKTMVEGEILRILQASNNKIENLPEQAKAELDKLATFNIRRAILMDAIYEKEEDIEVTPEELNKLLEGHAKTNNQSKDELVSNLYNSGQMDNFVGVLRVANVFDFIIDHSNNEDKESEEDNGDDQ